MLGQDGTEFHGVDVVRIGDLDADDVAIGSGIKQQSVAKIPGRGSLLRNTTVDIGSKGYPMPEADLKIWHGHGNAGV